LPIVRSRRIFSAKVIYALSTTLLLTLAMGHGLESSRSLRSLPPALVLSCPNPSDHIEMSEGKARQCTLDGMLTCGPGLVECPSHYSLQKCNASLRFRCEQSLESPVLYICCGKSAIPQYYDDSPAYKCPNAGQTPVVRNNLNLFCDAVGQRANCPPGSLCVSSINAGNMYICCYTAHSTTPICPSNTMPQPSALGYVT